MCLNIGLYDVLHLGYGDSWMVVYVVENISHFDFATFNA